MKRFATLFGSALLASVLAGCDGGGIQEGPATTGDGAATGQPDSFRKAMEQQGEKMKFKGTGRPKDVPKAKPTDQGEAPKDAAAK